MTGSVLVDPYRARGVDFGDSWDRSALGLFVPPRPRRRYDRPVAVDLFSGAGGFGCGFHQAGWQVAAASEFTMDAALTYMVNLARPGVRIHFDTPERAAEWDRRLAATYRLTPKQRKGKKPVDDSQLTGADGHILAAGTGWIANQPANHPGCEHFFVYDVRNLTGAVILDALQLDVGEVDCVFGGPPCQGFSTAGKQNVMDPRNSLVFEFARLICEIRPKTFVMENVPGMLQMKTPEGIPVVDAFCYAAASGGYAEYEALRSALGVAGGRAAVRGAKKLRRDAEQQDPAPAEQESLFDLPGISDGGGDGDG